MLDPELVAENARLRAIIARAIECLSEGDRVHPEMRIGRIPDMPFEHLRSAADFDLRLMAAARAILGETAIPDLCDHGVPDGEYCRECNAEYKRAWAEHEATGEG